MSNIKIDCWISYDDVEYAIDNEKSYCYFYWPSSDTINKWRIKSGETKFALVEYISHIPANNITSLREILSDSNYIKLERQIFRCL